MQLSWEKQCVHLYKLNKYKDWWMSLALREQQLLLSGMVLMTIVMIYVFVLSPLYTSVFNLRERISSNETLLSWMQDANQEITQLSQHQMQNNKRMHNSPVEVISVLQSQIIKAKLKDQLTLLKQANKDGIEMHFQKVEFDRLAELLFKLSKEQNIAILQISIKGHATTGFVNADIMVAG